MGIVRVTAFCGFVAQPLEALSADDCSVCKRIVWAERAEGIAVWASGIDVEPCIPNISGLPRKLPRSTNSLDGESVGKDKAAIVSDQGKGINSSFSESHRRDDTVPFCGQCETQLLLPKPFISPFRNFPLRG